MRRGPVAERGEALGDDVERRKVARGVDVADVQVPRPERVGDGVELVLRAAGPRLSLVGARPAEHELELGDADAVRIEDGAQIGIGEAARAPRRAILRADDRAPAPSRDGRSRRLLVRAMIVLIELK